MSKDHILHIYKMLNYYCQSLQADENAARLTEEMYKHPKGSPGYKALKASRFGVAFGGGDGLHVSSPKPGELGIDLDKDAMKFHNLRKKSTIELYGRKNCSVGDTLTFLKISPEDMMERFKKLLHKENEDEKIQI